jgi:hypothetical protein
MAVAEVILVILRLRVLLDTHQPSILDNGSSPMTLSAASFSPLPKVHRLVEGILNTASQPDSLLNQRDVLAPYLMSVGKYRLSKTPV